MPESCSACLRRRVNSLFAQEVRDRGLDLDLHVGDVWLWRYEPANVEIEIAGYAVEERHHVDSEK